MISIRRLEKRFAVGNGRVTALKGVDLEVGQGELFVIVGASGSGKTTLLRCVAGLEVPEAGEIRIDGRVVSSDAPPVWVPPQRRGFGMVFQSYAVWPHLSVYENVALPLTDGAHKLPRHEVQQRVGEALRLVQLEPLADRSATLLSGGQQQRVALARAIAVNSKLLLMDEPLSNLDARLREDVRGRIRDLAKQLGSTVLYVTHDQVEAMALADRIAVLREGELLQVGTPQEVYRKPCRAEVANFFGFVNWVEGSIAQPGQAETPLGVLSIPPERATQGEQVLLGFRPECLQPLLEATGPAQPNRVRGTVESSVFVGDQVVYTARVGGRSLTGKSRQSPGSIGHEIDLVVAPEDVLVFADAERPVASPPVPPQDRLIPI
jgi:ABC-type Fe3+/spermidine/putrescine transport system ATPase subunit